MMDQAARIFVAGHRGLVGSACVRALVARGQSCILQRTRQELDLRNKAEVHRFFEQERPEYVIDAAARVGGIVANSSFPVEFLVENLEIQNNLMSAAYAVGVKKALILGSSCIYPKHAPQPIPEEALLTGPLEPSNEAYAIAKIAGIRLAQAYSQQYGMNFISGMPTNLYGINDNFDLQSSHVLPALLRKFHEAKMSQATVVQCWGSGAPLREFMDADDCAAACLFLLDHYDRPEIINIGTGEEVTIKDLAYLLAKVTGFTGEIVWDTTRPDGTPRKLLDSSKLRGMGWRPSISLEEGVAKVYTWWRAAG
jgi:GDP-L-fucose synthase